MASTKQEVYQNIEVSIRYLQKKLNEKSQEYESWNIFVDQDISHIKLIFRFSNSNISVWENVSFDDLMNLDNLIRNEPAAAEEIDFMKNLLEVCDLQIAKSANDFKEENND